MAKKIKQYDEAEIIKMFNLERLGGNDQHPLMSEWTYVSATLSIGEQYLFDYITDNLLNKIQRTQRISIILIVSLVRLHMTCDPRRVCMPIQNESLRSSRFFL